MAQVGRKAATVVRSDVGGIIEVLAEAGGLFDDVETVAKVFREKGWDLVSAYPREWQSGDILAVIQRDGASSSVDSVDFVIHEVSSLDAEMDCLILDINPVLQRLSGQLVDELRERLPVSVSAEAEPFDDLIDARGFGIGSATLWFGILIGDEALPTMIIARVMKA